jgi:hypothetical protein
MLGAGAAARSLVAVQTTSESGREPYPPAALLLQDFLRQAHSLQHGGEQVQAVTPRALQAAAGEERAPSDLAYCSSDAWMQASTSGWCKQTACWWGGDVEAHQDAIETESEPQLGGH